MAGGKRQNYEALDDEILSHKLSETIGRFCRLLNEGAGRKKCKCPFHHEKTPSLHLDDNKGLWHCFGCGEGGNVFTFLQKIRGYDFKQAVDELCEFFSIDKSKYIVVVENANNNDNDITFYEITEVVAKYYQECLAKNKEAISYLKDIRGMNNDTLEEFGFGVAENDYESLVSHCVKNGVSVEDLILCGIVKQDEQNKDKKWLFFRDRIIIPIRNEQGKIVAFGGRIYKSGDNGAKYLNSSENIFFKKGSLLFNFDKAKRNLKQENSLIVVEGYMDAVALWQSGIKTAVAPLGTSITGNHLAKIFNYCKEPIFLFDSDEAGKKASIRACEMIFAILEVGFIPKFCCLDGAKDVDEFLRKYTREDLQERLKNASELQDFIFEMKSRKYNFDDPNHKGICQKEIFDLVALIPDENLRRVFREHFRKKFFFDKKKNASSNRDSGFWKHQFSSSKNYQMSPIEPVKNESLDFMEKKVVAMLLQGDFLKKEEYFLENVLSKLSKKNQALFYNLKEKDKEERQSFIKNKTQVGDGKYDFERINDFLLSLEIKKIEISNLPQSVKLNEIQKILDKKKQAILKTFEGYDEI